jgi:hypothetical protein
VVQITLANQTGRDLAGLRIEAPVPPLTQAADSWQGRPDQNRAAAEGSTLRWYGVGVKHGDRLPPFTYRLVPTPGQRGAIVFRGVVIQPRVLSESGADQAGVPALPLHGLWGDGGLRRTVLPSGLTVLTRERPESATVALRLAVRAGSRDESDATSGGSHWLEHAFYLGTRGRPDNQAIFAPIADAGGQSNASTGWEHTDYWYVVPAAGFEPALDVLADQMVNSTFPREAFDRERRVVIEELKRRQDTPSVRAFDELFRLVYRVSPLRRDPGGTLASVQTVPIEAMLAHKAVHYVAGNMVLAAIGDLRHDEAVV